MDCPCGCRFLFCAVLGVDLQRHAVIVDVGQVVYVTYFPFFPQYTPVAEFTCPSGSSSCSGSVSRTSPRTSPAPAPRTAITL